MKFLFLSPVVWNFYPLQNQNLAKVLSQKEHEVVYIEPVKYKNSTLNSRFGNVSENLRPEKLKVIERTLNIRKSLFVFIYENYNNTLIIAHNKPDVVVCYDHLMGILPCIYCYFKRLKFIFNVSDDWDNVPQSTTARFAWKFFIKHIIARFSYAIASISTKQFELFSKKNKNTFLLPNGLNNQFIENLNKPTISEITDTINFIANLRDWYDFDLLFDVFSELPEITLNIYGSGPLHKALAEKAISYKNINIMGNVSHEETPKLLKETFIGIIPLKKNKLNDSTSPVKLFDYWAAQKAVIATPTAETRAIGDDCLLFASTKEEWILHIRFLTANPMRRKMMEGKGYEKVIEFYNYDVISKLFLKNLHFKEPNERA